MNGQIERTWEVYCANRQHGCPAFRHGYGYPIYAARLLRAEGWRRWRGLWCCPECARQGRAPE